MIDQLLNIQTTQKRDWPIHIRHKYSRLEPTAYPALKQLEKLLEFDETSHWVDIGCGSGRTLFYFNHFAQIEATGIELHPVTFQELTDNLDRYQQAHPDKPPIHLIQADATKTHWQDSYTHLYFFNPFSLPILKRVLQAIQANYRQSSRDTYLIFYYVLPEIERFLSQHTQLELVYSVPYQHAIDAADRFMIYRI